MNIPEKYRTVLLLGGAWLISSLAILAVSFTAGVPADDVVNRYAPMAEAFARGDWSEAFHPRFGTLFPVLSGTVCKLLRCDGVTACRLTGWLLWSATVFPVFHLARMLFGLWPARLAGTGCLFISHLTRFIPDGVRDNGRALGLALLALGLVGFFRDAKSFRSALWCAVGAAILATLREDGIVVAGLGILALAVRDAAVNRRGAWRSLAAAALFGVLLTPQVCWIYRLYGYPVSGSRQMLLLRRHFGDGSSR